MLRGCVLSPMEPQQTEGARCHVVASKFLISGSFALGFQMGSCVENFPNLPLWPSLIPARLFPHCLDYWELELISMNSLT